MFFADQPWVYLTLTPVSYTHLDVYKRQLFGSGEDSGWHILHDPCNIKGRAGVAIASRVPATAHRIGLGGADLQDSIQSSGRWLEADFELGGKPFTVVSTYVHSGEVDTPKQGEKYKFCLLYTSRCV